MGSEKFYDIDFRGFGFGRPKNGGVLDLIGTYAVWLCVVVILYPFCKWYSNYKLNRRENKWLRYL